MKRLSELKAIGSGDEMRIIREEEIEQKVEVPGIVAVRDDLNGNMTCLQLPPGRRSSEQQIIRTVVTFVIEVPECIGHAGHDNVVNQFDANLDARVRVFIFIVRVKP